MPATIKEIAREAGVSETTVSLSFRPDSRIGEATRKKVLAVARRHNYVPNEAARRLRLGKSRTLGLIVNEITNPFYATLVRETERVAEARGYQVLFSESRWSAEKETEIAENMLRLRVQGILLCPAEGGDAGIRMLEEWGVPYILLDSSPKRWNGPRVWNDLEGAAAMAAAHLAEVGCREVAFLTGARERQRFSAFRRLENAFGKAARQTDLPWTRDRIVPAGFSLGEGRAGMEALLKLHPSVDGVFCVNDLCALGAMEALRAAGRLPGHDVAVMGVDDLDVSALTGLSLTSIRQPYDTLAEIAATALVEHLETEAPLAIRESVPPALVRRGSTLDFRPAHPRRRRTQT